MRLSALIATWFGSGLTPKGPGTAGAVAGLACAGLAWWFWPQPAWTYGAWAAVLFLPSVWAASEHARHTGKKDPQDVVVDEVIGQWITLAGATRLDSPWAWLLALGLFRLFDIVKPPPVRWFEKLPGGWGIVMDDVVAGLLGAVVMRLIGWNNLY